MGSMSVTDGNRVFEGRAAQVAGLREEIENCFAAANQPERLDQLLGKAGTLVEELIADMKKIREELGDEYDLDLFQALIDELHKTTRQLASGLDLELVRRLPTGWHPVCGNGGHRWFRGTSVENGNKVLKDGRFDSMFTRTGAYFGVGTYFTPDYSVAEKYGACVFGMNDPGTKILRVKQVKQPAEPAPNYNPFAEQKSYNPFDDDFVPPGSSSSSAEQDEDGDEGVPFRPCWWIGDLVLEVNLGPAAEQRIKRAVNAGKELTAIAREMNYDAVEFLESDENHILVVLKNLGVTGENVLFLDLTK